MGKSQLYKETIMADKSNNKDKPKYINSPESNKFQKHKMLYGMNFIESKISKNEPRVLFCISITPPLVEKFSVFFSGVITRIFPAIRLETMLA